MGGKQAKGSAVAESLNHSYISHQKLISETLLACLGVRAYLHPYCLLARCVVSAG
jgi:hypothetical protein